MEMWLLLPPQARRGDLVVALRSKWSASIHFGSLRQRALYPTGRESAPILGKSQFSAKVGDRTRLNY